MSTGKEIKDLGCVNSWKESPQIYKECCRLEHPMTIRNLGRCYNEYTCEICGIKYTIDSGD
jgi:hypothetical protein